eukprot:TRINITY_DN24896_c0_g1_i2.p1 TRINITY_DN24896_c0_g1~~TRINITY_DN24896_c0_g1_i2.p1  ORF type:complete len:472 (+),score=126.78 TRINITY_DN24896_c0_g1_i2:36-1418(+)
MKRSASSSLDEEAKVLLIRCLPTNLTKDDVEGEAYKHGTVLQCFMNGKNRNVFLRMVRNEEVERAVAAMKKNGVKGTKVDVEEGYRPASTVSKVLMAHFENLKNKDEQTVMSCEQLKMLIEDHSREGAVQKIMLFVKHPHLKGLIQMASYEDSAKAMAALDNSEVDVGEQTSKLMLSYSKNQEITIDKEHYGKDFLTGYGLGECPIAGETLLSGNIGKGAVQAASQQISQTASHNIITQPKNPRLLLVNGCREDTVPEMLIRLFGAVGKVKGVKILLKQRSAAIIEYYDAEAASRAIVHLNHSPLHGNILDVRPSKADSCKPAIPNTPDYDLTLFLPQDDPSQRPDYAWNPPSSSITISRIPSGYSQEDFDALLKNFVSTEPLNITWDSPTPAFSTATVIFGSINTATSVLVGLHSVELEASPPGGLCVYFTPVNAVTPAAAFRGQIIYDPTHPPPNAEL